MVNFNPYGVYREDPQHVYRNPKGAVLCSVSKALELVSTPFQKESISRKKAVNELAKKGVAFSQQAILEQQQSIKNEWQQKADKASDQGTRFHQACEDFIATGKVEGEYKKLVEEIYMTYFKDFYRSYAEIIVSDGDHLAGTIDVPSSHSRQQEKLIHIRDFKTNKEKPANVLKYNTFMLPPLSHLIQNNYIKYALQQSIYAYLLERCGFRIASIGLIWIDVKKSHHELIPVPYMREEARIIHDIVITSKLN